MIREERHHIEALQITLELSVVLMHQCLSFEISASVIWELHERTKKVMFIHQILITDLGNRIHQHT